jgi:NarL family two-component system response regulator LiaR
MDTASKIKVLIVDDHEMVRRGLSVMLKAFEEFEVVGETGDARLALTLCGVLGPDVVLMDLLMPIINGIEATRLIRDKFPNIKVVVLTSSVDKELIDAALEAGAVSYLLKTGTIDDVVNSLYNAYHGKPTLSPEALNILISNVRHPQVLGEDLTHREREVLALMAEGLKNSQIAERLSISNSTAKNHIMNIFAKLRTRNRTETIALALQHKLLAKHQ